MTSAKFCFIIHAPLPLATAANQLILFLSSAPLRTPLPSFSQYRRHHICMPQRRNLRSLTNPALLVPVQGQRVCRVVGGGDIRGLGVLAVHQGSDAVAVAPVQGDRAGHEVAGVGRLEVGAEQVLRRPPRARGGHDQEVQRGWAQVRRGSCNKYVLQTVTG